MVTFIRITGAQDEFSASVFPDLTTDAWLKPGQSGVCGVDPQPPQPLSTVSLAGRNPPRLQVNQAGRQAGRVKQARK